jgi:Ca2+-binding RTX toxin-like protein
MRLLGNPDTMTGRNRSDIIKARGDADTVTAPITIDLAAGTATDGTNNVTWDTTDGPFIETATGGSGADNITGSTRTNIVNGHLGADTINVADGDGADLDDCGDGTDTVIKDVGDSARNCEL